MFLLSVLALVGCQVSEFECETEKLDVADEGEVLDDLGVSVDELLAGMVGVRTFPASNRAGDPLPAELDVARGEGTAVFHDATMVEFTHLQAWPVQHDMDLAIICNDRVEVPITYALTTEDGSIAVEGAEFAQGTVLLDGGPAQGSIVHHIDLDTATLPEPPAAANGALFEAHFRDGNLYEASLSWLDTEKAALVYPPVEASP